MNNFYSLNFASTLSDLCEANSSFDRGILRVCYAGANRNNSYISKEVLAKCANTIYNCPVVCNYMRDADTIGGHDVEIVKNENGDLRIVNLTQPVGVVPESAKIWFDTVQEDDGTEHEYLFTEVLLWKRQEAYQKIKADGALSHSMEIDVTLGELKDGVYHIEDFVFNALCLVGCTPCYESSSLELFSANDFKLQFAELLQDLKSSFPALNSVSGDDNKENQNSMKGGTYTLNTQKNFELTSNILNEIHKALEAETIHGELGPIPRFCFADCDFDLAEIYCWDCTDWLLYGLTYQLDGDTVVIDFESKKRMKYAVVPFGEEEGEQPSPFAPTFEKMREITEENQETEDEVNQLREAIDALNEELALLRDFKAETEEAIAKNAREELFADFADLNGVEAFEELRINCEELSLEELEEKLYAIRGKVNAPSKFSLKGQSPKMKVDPIQKIESEPYGGLFIKYANSNLN